MRVYIGKQIADLRKVAGTTQKQLAWAVGVEEEAVRQWEAGRQNPNLAGLRRIADYFHVDIDFLLTGETRDTAEEEAAAAADKQLVIRPALPDDGRLRVVQFLGSRIVARDDFDPDRPILLSMEACGAGEKRPIEIWGSAHIEGNVGGSVTAGGDITCGHVAGGVKSGKNVTCGDIAGGAVVGGSLDCGKINGSVICRGKISEEK